jgi:type II secretory pathway pseudopilin PulG
MPTGERTPAAQRGFTYLILLFAVAAGGAALAAAATLWTTAAKRQRELESMFRGQAIADAVGRYRRLVVAAAPGQPLPGGPKTLEVLIEDPRWPNTVRHLRRIYDDPLTGKPDWVLLRDADGSINGLHSRSDLPALVLRDLPPAESTAPRKVSDRVYQPSAAALAASASSPPGVDAVPPTPTDTRPPTVRPARPIPPAPKPR